MTLAQYLKELDTISESPSQKRWYAELQERIHQGRMLFERAVPEQKRLLQDEFRNWVRTEELKAWYGEPERGSLFQGTSVSSLTIPCELESPLYLEGIEHLEHVLADEYIKAHDKHEHAVRNSTRDNVDKWMSEGLYYGVVIGSKMISQAFNLTIPKERVLFDVDGVAVDPHEIASYSQGVRQKYFTEVRKLVDCFEGLDLTQTELEESLVLSDISKPKIGAYDGKLILGPVRCNEICTLISRHTTELIRRKTNGRINPRSLMVTIYDSDTPYTYHQIAGYYGHELAPTLPGLTVLGSSGTIDAFRWLYAYRVSLIAQKMMKGSLYSEVERRFIPFVFYGVLVERDADILLNLNDLGMLRYRGQLSPYIEFTYLLPKLSNFLSSTRSSSFTEGRFQ